MTALRDWKRWGVWLFTLGGALWVLKVTLITVNHLRGRDLDSFGVPVVYVAAVTLLAIGATAVGATLLRRHPWWSQLLAAIAAVPAVVLLYNAIDALLKATFAGVGPQWLAEELGIAATGALCLVGGALLARAVGLARGGATAAHPIGASKAV